MRKQVQFHREMFQKTFISSRYDVQHVEYQVNATMSRRMNDFQRNSNTYRANICMSLHSQAVLILCFVVSTWGRRRNWSFAAHSSSKTWNFHSNNYKQLNAKTRVGYRTSVRKLAITLNYHFQWMSINSNVFQLISLVISLIFNGCHFKVSFSTNSMDSNWSQWISLVFKLSFFHSNN
jgi:hypothetical protein